jgi:hypothetical protein
MEQQESEGLKIIDHRTPMEDTSVAMPAISGESPAAMLMAAMDKNVDLEKLERFMDLQTKWEENEAKKAYHKAMAAFAANLPKIEKDRHVSFENSKGGTTQYDHASLGNVSEKIQAALSPHGLHASWKPVQQEGGLISVTCTITHELGHSESTTLSANPDASGGKNNIQAIGSTIAYLERYTVLALTGLATHDMDDDGNSAAKTEYITEDQLKQIQDIIKQKRINDSKVLQYFKLETFNQVPAKSFKTVMDTLKTAKGEPIYCPNKDGKEIKAAECKDCKDRVGCPEWEGWDDRS